MTKDNRRKPYTNIMPKWYEKKSLTASTLLALVIASASGLTYVNSIAASVEKTNLEVRYIKDNHKYQNDRLIKDFNKLSAQTQKQYDDLRYQNQRILNKLSGLSNE